MRITYEDYTGDQMTVSSMDKTYGVTIRIDAISTKSNMFDLDADQVDDLIHQLTQWRRFQPISITRRD